jgi:hypothetical protein
VLVRMVERMDQVLAVLLNQLGRRNRAENHRRISLATCGVRGPTASVPDALAAGSVLPADDNVTS